MELLACSGTLGWASRVWAWGIWGSQVQPGPSLAVEVHRVRGHRSNAPARPHPRGRGGQPAHRRRRKVSFDKRFRTKLMQLPARLHGVCPRELLLVIETFLLVST